LKDRSHPADDVVAMVIAQLRGTDWASLQAATIAALRRDRGPSNEPDGYRSDTLGSGARSSGGTTATEAAALAAMGRHERDEHHELTGAALGAVHDAARCISRAVAALTRIDEIASRPKQAYRLPQCAEAGCTADAAPGRKGRCEACYRFRKRRADHLGVAWSEAGPVPVALIEARPALGKPARVHVTGPFAREVT
jgi:hypothetical protein